jgi:hypothetical protein
MCDLEEQEEVLATELEEVTVVELSRRREMDAPGSDDDQVLVMSE